MDRTTIIERDRAHLTKLFGHMFAGQMMKTECYAAGGWAHVKRLDADMCSVKMPRSRVWRELSVAETIDALLAASHGE